MKITKKQAIIASVIAALVLIGVIIFAINKNVFTRKNTDVPAVGTEAGSITGNESGSAAGNIAGSETGSAEGSIAGSETGSAAGNIAGSETGNADGNKTENETANAAGGAAQTEEEAAGDRADAPDKSIYMDASKSVDERIEALLSQMTLQEKAAQMVQPEQAGISLAQIRQYNVGSVLSGGGSAPAAGNNASDWNKHITAIKEASAASRLGIPVLYGVDAVHGNNNVSSAVVFPHNIGLGAADDEELMIRIGQVTASEVRAIAAQWTFAPCVGNARNELWGRTYECFSEETDTISRLSVALLKGLQGEPTATGYLDPAHVLATAKHYIGEGYTENGTNQGDVVMDPDEWEELLRTELLKPYKALVDSGVMTLMPSYSSVNGLKCHENAYLLNDILKGELGFTGLVVSDYNGIEQIRGRNLKEQVITSVNAGIDLLMEPFNWESCINFITEAVSEGSITEERLDDAVRRILRVKFIAGLFDEESGSEAEKSAVDAFGSDEHREVARRAVRESVTLLTNSRVGNTTAMELLQNAKSVTLAGPKADDIGAQCGGWTISWQGSNGQITKGTTLLKALENTGIEVNYDPLGENIAKNVSDAYVIVTGEDPYAETSGDRSASSLNVSASDRALLDMLGEDIAQIRAQGKPVILVLYSGRPINIASYVDMFDAVVEAWLPGTEGDGLADVLVGEYDFTGTTTFTWPWYASQIGSKFSDDSVVLFRRGTGLRRDGSSIKAGGTAVIGTKPEIDEEELAKSGLIDLGSTGYVLEAENYNNDSYLVTTNVANNYTFVDGWQGQWANTKWNVWIPESGAYTLHFHIAAAKDSKTVAIYYAEGSITDDGAANKTTVPMKKTADLNTYEDFTLDVTLNKGPYEFKFMNSVANGCDFRLDRIEFELRQ
ncbi:MAG: glycoside hydrolase family 3 C-terminal domain-containing protein [Lachnospiraceae bacterium]|nr:glycoside hydrolase family 3 C-terminal domain-containing protein [Lachnospiraceae bacterium]